MRRIAFSLMALLAVGNVVTGTTVAAQQVKMPSSPVVGQQGSTMAAPAISIAWSGPSLTTAEVARLAAMVARADTAASEHRVSDAAKLYWSVVAQQRAAAEYPADVLRRIALMYYDANEEYIAAEVFMEMAETAAEFGDPTGRLRSLFDAALMYQRLGRSDRVADCGRHIWPLLKSTAIPESVRADIRARLVER